MNLHRDRYIRRNGVVQNGIELMLGHAGEFAEIRIIHVIAYRQVPKQWNRSKTVGRRVRTSQKTLSVL